MKSILIAILFVLVSAPAFAGNENVEYCKTFAKDIVGCKAIFAPCVALENARDRQEKKNAAWNAACEFDILDIAACTDPLGTEIEFCKCIAEEAGCPGKAVGKCAANFAAQAQVSRHGQRLVDAFGACF